MNAIRQLPDQSINAAPSDPLALTPLQAAELLQIDEKTLRKYSKSGEIPCRRFGRNIRYSPAVLRAWLAGRDASNVQRPLAQDALSGMES